MDAVGLFRDVLDEMDRRDAQGVRSLVVVQDNGDGTANVTDGNPNNIAPWPVPLAYGLTVLPDDRLLAVTVDGYEIAVLILRRAV